MLATTLPSGSINNSVAELSVVIMNDDIVEDPESFQLSIATTDILTDAVLAGISGNPATVTILDNDGEEEQCHVIVM